MLQKTQLIQAYSPDLVTSIDSSSEVDPQEVGLTQEQIDTIWDSVVACYESGIHPALTVCVRRHGKIVLNRAIGHTHGNEPSDPQGHQRVATPDSLFNLYSASKAIAAVVVHHMDENGLIHLEDPLHHYLPEFASKRKRYITIRHVLLHQAGIPKVPKDALDLDVLHRPGEIRRVMSNSSMQWGAGRKTGYHAITGGFVIGELVKEVTGMDIREYLKRFFLDPLGFKTFNFGVTDKLIGDVAPNVYTGYPLPNWAEKIAERVLGVTYREAIELSNDPRFLTAIIPAANIIGTAEETSRFYEVLLRGGELDGVRVLKPETINRAIAEQTHSTIDRMLGMPMRYSLGFMLGRSRFSLYGGNTPKAFGHMGMVNISGYADPERSISVGILNNGKPGITIGMVKFYNIMNTIANTIPKVKR
ncbi:MAG: beta-lactamase family protein [Pseudomonadales bacterium]|nr:beta-lactamase family protein [Pseudomonadales bacterium]